MLLSAALPRQRFPLHWGNSSGGIGLVYITYIMGNEFRGLENLAIY